MKNDIIYY